MKVGFRSESYERLEKDPHFTGGWPPVVVKDYRFILNFLRQAIDERDLAALKFLDWQQLDGPRDHQHSLSLNFEWRLIVEIDGSEPNSVEVVKIEEIN